MRRRLRKLPLLVLALLGLLGPTGLPPAPARAAPDPADPAGVPLEDDDATHLEVPPFPGPRTREALRLHLDSRFVPDHQLGPGHATLYRPELRGRLTLPVSERAVVRVAARGRIARYRFRGGDGFRFGGVSLVGDSLDAYETRLELHGAYRLNPEGRALLREGEVWSLLGHAFGGSEFEDGAFREGLSGGGALALGYQLEGRLRVAAGVSVESSIDGEGASLGPTGSLRWDLTDDLTLRNRGLGLQLEYGLSESLELFASGFRASDEYRLRGGSLELFASGFRASDEYRLRDATGALDELSFRDRQLLAGAGFEWKLSRRLRLNAEAGALAWRRVRVHDDDLGTLASQRGDPAPYLELRLEVRP